jgi:DNA-binding transcriptional MerR regulator
MRRGSSVSRLEPLGTPRAKLRARASPAFRIGELASRSGRSVHAIRWYESQGLIPGVVRDSGGRRVYDELHVGWLELMDRLRQTGMSIAEMRTYTALVKQGRVTLRERQDLLSSHRVRVKAKVAELKLALKLIDSKIDFYGEWIATGDRPKGLPTEQRATTPLKAPRRPRRAA